MYSLMINHDTKEAYLQTMGDGENFCYANQTFSAMKRPSLMTDWFNFYPAYLVAEPLLEAAYNIMA